MNTRIPRLWGRAHGARLFWALALVGLLLPVACSGPFQVSDSLGEWGGEGVAAMIETGSAAGTPVGK